MVHQVPVSQGVVPCIDLDLRALVHLQAHQEFGDPLLLRRVVIPVRKLRHPGKGSLRRGPFRRVLDPAHDPDLPVLREHVEVAVCAGKVRGVGLVLDVPQPPLGVVDVQPPFSVLVLHGDIVFQAVAAGRRVPELIHAEGGPHRLGDTAGVCHDPRPGEIEQHLSGHGQARRAAGRHAQGGAAHDLEVRRDRAVDLVDVVLLEEDGVAHVRDTGREVPGAAGVHAVAVRGEAVKHVPVEDVSQL